MQEIDHQCKFLPKTYCSWLKPNGEFEIEHLTLEHMDYIREYAKHIKIKDTTAFKEFMLETNWIRVRGYPNSKDLVFQKVQPFTKDQRNTIKDLEIFGYVCHIQSS
jgi:hypothetical protein